jgi:alanine racemase
LGIASPEELKDLVRLRLTPFITDEEYAGLLSHAARAEGLVCEVHLKVDSGMGRIGCSCAELPALARFVSREGSLRLAGIATHLAAEDSLDADDRDYTRRQIGSFLDAVDSVRREGIDAGIVHAANSGAIVLHPETHLDMVRPGILTYGYLPDECLSGSIEVVPVMELRTGVASIKRIQRGTSVSYGRTWTAERETEIATIPVGYDDGIPRAAAAAFRSRSPERPTPSSEGFAWTSAWST